MISIYDCQNIIDMTCRFQTYKITTNESWNTNDFTVGISRNSMEIYVEELKETINYTGIRLRHHVDGIEEDNYLCFQTEAGEICFPVADSETGWGIESPKSMISRSWKITNRETDLIVSVGFNLKTPKQAGFRYNPESKCWEYRLFMDNSDKDDLIILTVMVGEGKIWFSSSEYDIEFSPSAIEGHTGKMPGLHCLFDTFVLYIPENVEKEESL